MQKPQPPIILHEDPETLSTASLSAIPVGTIIMKKGSSPQLYVKNDDGLFRLDSVTFTKIT